MPPPSQAGKFKPRKPAKKIRAGATANAAAPEPVLSSAQQHPTRSGGAGGRGLGGRKRTPLPQGQVFFTATPAEGKSARAKSSRAAAAASSSGGGDGKKGSSSAGATRGSTATGAPAAAKPGLREKRRDEEANEEVVGILDKAIGARFETGNAKQDQAQADRVPSSSSRSRKSTKAGRDGDGDEGPPAAAAAPRKTASAPVDAALHTYDSDSSEDDNDGTLAQHFAPATIRSSSQGTTPGLLPPSRLPFPVAPYPVGVGSQTRERPSMYAALQTGDESDDDDEVGHADQPVSVKPMVYSNNNPRPSPFVNPNNPYDMAAERDSWFLVQMPTRLPPVKEQKKPATAKSNDFHGQRNRDAENADDNNIVTMDDNGDVVMVDDPTSTGPKSGLAEVVRNPIQTDCFDNCLASAIPGKIGKLLVYKSGKTVLLLQGSSGTPEIRMDVTEGLTCNFQQQAVVIDPDKGTYVKLGDVGKTVVVSPDIDKAFGSRS